MNNKSIAFLFGLFILLGILFSYLSDRVFVDSPSRKIPSEKINTATLYFVGDIMMDRGVRNMVNIHGSGDYNFLFQNVGFLKEADIAFANLEGSVSNRGRNVGSQYSFRMDPRSLEALKNAGFDVVSVANNHAGDWTIDAFKDTLTHLNEIGIVVVGGGENHTAASTVKIFNKNGIKIGFLAFSDVGPNWLGAGSNTPGILIADDPQIREIISTASEQVDILVVAYHFGAEYEPLATYRQQFLGRLAIDNGARLVVGAHPHVIEDTEKYKNGFIAYSLGNFIFDQPFSPETLEGGVLKVVVNKDGIATTTLEKVKLDSHFVPALEK